MGKLRFRKRQPAADDSKAARFLELLRDHEWNTAARLLREEYIPSAGSAARGARTHDRTDCKSL